LSNYKLSKSRGLFADQKYFKADRVPINDGCIECGKHRGKRHEKLYRLLRPAFQGDDFRCLCSACLRSSRDERYRILSAFHEAGHTVMAIHQGIPFLFATVEGWEGLPGNIITNPHVLFDLDKENRITCVTEKNFDDFKMQTLINFAGFAAEAILLGSCFGYARVYGGDRNRDVSDRHDYANFAYVRNRQTEFAKMELLLFNQAKKILREHWKSVQKIALGLLEHETLTYMACIKQLDAKMNLHLWRRKEKNRIIGWRSTGQEA